MKLIQAILLTSLLTYAAIHDYKTREIPNALCLGVSLLALLDFKLTNILGLTIGLLVLIIAAFFCENRFGGGDIKLIMATSLVLGFYPTLYGLILALILQLIFVAITRRSKSQSMPLAPFLAIGFLTTYLI